jgi:hypothetical protein
VIAVANKPVRLLRRSGLKISASAVYHQAGTGVFERLWVHVHDGPSKLLPDILVNSLGLPGRGGILNSDAAAQGTRSRSIASGTVFLHGLKSRQSETGGTIVNTLRPAEDRRMAAFHSPQLYSVKSSSLP